MCDVLFITVDSLRADHMGFLGYDRETTPTLDRLAGESVVFENATAHGPTTFTSFPSILTGRHAYENPEYPNLAGTTVAEQFRSAGYHTLSITSNAWTSPTYDYDRGFDEVHNLGRGPRSADSRWDRIRHRIGDTLGDGVVFRFVKGAYDRLRDINPDDRSEEDVIHDVVVDHLEREEQTFTWVHYMTTHTPYTPDPAESVPYVDEIPDIENQRGMIERARESPDTVPERDRRRLKNLYDASIRHLDRRVEDLLETIHDDTVVCITADHGEAFWEHGYFEHPPDLHQQLLAVPLLIKTPDVSPRRVEVPVGLSSVPATLRWLAGIADRTENALPPWGEWSSPVCSAVAHGSRWEPADASTDTLKVAVRDDNWKFIRRHDGDDTLVGLASDPEESENLASDNPSVVKRLSNHADEFVADFTFGQTAELPDELEDRLSNLGYVQ
ncbi:MAG: sulfatase [Halobacteriales archaeon]